MTDLTPEREQAYSNTDRELWREGDGDGNGMSYYEPSIHVTEQGGIGINVGGLVYVKTLREWHGLVAALATERARAGLLSDEVARTEPFDRTVAALRSVQDQLINAEVRAERLGTLISAARDLCNQETDTYPALQKALADVDAIPERSML